MPQVRPKHDSGRRVGPAALLLTAAVLAAGPGGALDCWEEVAPVYWETDVASLIGVRVPDDVSFLREALIAHLWGELGLPASRVLDSIELDIESPVRALGNLLRVDHYTVRMEHRLESHIFHFHPRRGNNRLILYHQGHTAEHYGADEERVIRFFLARGFAVLAFSMPLFGPNAHPEMRADHFQLVRLQTPAIARTIHEAPKRECEDCRRPTLRVGTPGRSQGRGPESYLESTGAPTG